MEALRALGILVADVAEVENLLCLPEALQAVSTHLKAPPESSAATEKAVMAELAKAIDQQALGRALAEIQFRLNGFGPKISKSDSQTLRADLAAFVSGIDVGSTIANCRQLFEQAVESNNYRSASKIYNCKGVIAFVATSFGTKKDVYCRMVIDFIKSAPDGDVAKAMRDAIEGVADPATIPLTPPVEKVSHRQYAVA